MFIHMLYFYHLCVCYVLYNFGKINTSIYLPNSLSHGFTGPTQVALMHRQVQWTLNTFALLETEFEIRRAKQIELSKHV